MWTKIQKEFTESVPGPAYVPWSCKKLEDVNFLDDVISKKNNLFLDDVKSFLDDVQTFFEKLFWMMWKNFLDDVKKNWMMWKKIKNILDELTPLIIEPLPECAQAGSLPKYGPVKVQDFL